MRGVVDVGLSLTTEYYGDAVEYHSKHLESSYLNDKFVAHTNLGLLFAGLNQPGEAALHHQHALRYVWFG